MDPQSEIRTIKVEKLIPVRGAAASVVFVGVLILLTSFNVLAQIGGEASPPLHLSPENDFYHLGPYVDVLKDHSGELTLDQVRNPRLSLRFQPNRGVMLHLGTTKGAVWLRFRLIQDLAPGDKSGPWIVELSKEHVDRLDIYLPRPGGGYSRIRAGRARPLNPAMIVSRTPAVSISPELLEGSYIYFRLANLFGLGMTAQVRAPRAFQFHLLADSYTLGILFGVPLALALFNLIIFIFFRDRVYLYYVIYILSMFGYLLMLHGQVYLLEIFDLKAELTIFGVLAGLILFFGCMFSRAFLLTKKNCPFWDRIILGLMGLALIKIAVSLMGYHVLANHIAQFAGLVSPVVSISVGAVCWRKGYTPARFYLIAWSVLSLSIVWHVLVSLNFLPWSGVSGLMMMVGSALEAVLLSFALADRIRTIQKEQKRLRRATRHYRQLSNMDSLTGLFNARYLRDNLEPLMAKVRRDNRPLSLMIIDVDDFKLFNDTYGHPEGDKVLAALGLVIRECVRRADVPCRYGGEEFCIILPGATIGQAAMAAERIREQFETLAFSLEETGEQVNATVSIGAAPLQPGQEGLQLLSEADKALYRAKSEGKNMVVLAS